METDHVALFEKGIQVDETNFGVHLVTSVATGRGDDFHTESSGQIGDGAANPPKADNAHGQAVEFDQLQLKNLREFEGWQ